MIRQLRVYQIEPTLKDAFDKRFKEHALRIMKTYEFKIAAMWYSEFDGNTEFVYVLEWSDAQTMHKQWEAFMADTEWEDIKRESRAVHGEMVLAKIRDQILDPIDWFHNAV